MSTISVDGKPIDSNSWTPPVLGIFRKYQFVSCAIFSGAEVAIFDAITGLPLGSFTSGELALGLVASSVGSTRFMHTDFMRKRAMRVHVARLYK